MQSIAFVCILLVTLITSQYTQGDGSVDNWLVRAVATDYYESALHALTKHDINEALSSLTSSIDLFPTFYACEKIGWLYENLGFADLSLYWYKKCLDLDTQQISLNIRNGNAAYQIRDYANALLHVNHALDLYPDSIEGLFQKAVTLQNMGDIQGAAYVYFEAVEAHPLEIKSVLNLAALHHKYGSVNDALFFYQMALSRIQTLMTEATSRGNPHLNRHYLMVKSNLAAAYLQLGVLSRAFDEITELIRTLSKEQADHCQSSGTIEARLVPCDEVERTISSSLGVQMIIQRASALWRGWEVLVDRVVKDTLSNVAAGLSFEGPLLPFDTLLTVMALSERLAIARAASAVLSRGRQELTDVSIVRNVKPQKLRIGFMSFDFNNHPTAHLVEGIFSVIRRYSDKKNNSASTKSSRFADVELYIYSYGKDDNSTYRRQLVALADHFIELSQLSHLEAAERIHQDQLHLLLDMQLHTLGHRFEITAHKPAPVQINYLVYPGTSGANFMNYIIADPVVIPAEQASFYSESLLLLPPTYQVSFYDRLTHLVDPRTVGMSNLERRTYLRRFVRLIYVSVLLIDIVRLHGLPQGSSDVIFCNFNKIDKIDPESFALWMSVSGRMKITLNH